ncbi:FAD/NAD(P)-binding domain-containing protein [Lepidopterella palustris CBS 459.81]|uniref:FAD/NAD(P)-binding domain-containing protein n=1 Tax=Lepidopterella palustris CBS 459.81 TaxID=1314670 RepID=A0A8E2JCD2_9PEZI|nr:FAD/NAD(P)-binding domain-containing protein [Lepidopterella palustris CBS 459.81]
MSFNTEVLIIGAGMPVHKFEIIEKSNDVGGTWLANTYPGCGCNPRLVMKVLDATEIQSYFRGVADQYNISLSIQFHSTVEKVVWDEAMVTIKDRNAKKSQTRRCKVLISGVGAPSLPKECELPGDVVVLGNRCSAIQFVPILSDGPDAVKRITQFNRQVHYLSPRENSYYSAAFKNVMRYEMEHNFSEFTVQGGRPIWKEQVKTNEQYIKQTAPEKHPEALIPKRILSDRRVHADAIVLAIVFATQQMLFPIETRDKKGISVNYHVVIYTVECQINVTLRLIAPILKTFPSYHSRSILASLSLHRSSPSLVQVKPEAARADNAWTQGEVKKFVWASGWTYWAMDPKAGMNIMIIFFQKRDFMYKDSKSGKEVNVWGSILGWANRALTVGLVFRGGLAAVSGGWR